MIENTHYCVANISETVAGTSTQVLANAAFYYVSLLAEKGKSALVGNPPLLKGVNIMAGKILIVLWPNHD
ncbi:MAG: hypothetical protein ACRBCS_13845 [Cellvibrionaceae bacterium]